MSNIPMEDTLPEKLSELLRLAVADMEKAKLAGFKFNMLQWYSRIGDDCAVCMAGAVMVCSLDIKLYGDVEPNDFPEEIAAKLWAINYMRDFRFEQAYNSCVGTTWGLGLDGLMWKLRRKYGWSENFIGYRAPSEAYLEAAAELEKLGC